MNTQLAILGDGLIAKTLALACQHFGIKTERIAKSRPEYHNDPRSYAIAPSSLRMLNALGLEFGDAELTVVSRVEIGFGDVLKEPLLPIANDAQDMMVMIDHNILAAKLDKALNSQAINEVVREFDPQEFVVHLPELDLKTSLLIIAEGKYGEAATKLGFGTKRHNYNQHAITAKLHTQIPHNNIARQLFMPTGPLGILPFGERGVSIVWSQEDRQAEAIFKLNDADFLAFLHSKIGDIYGELEMVAPRSSFPIYHATPTRLTQDRIALIGDSAHALHPIAGQGLNIGLRDVACLVEGLQEAKRLGLDLGSEAVLAQYRQWRKADTARLTHLTRGMNAMTTMKGAPVATLAGLSKNFGGARLENWLGEQSDPPLNPQPPLLAGHLN